MEHHIKYTSERKTECKQTSVFFWYLLKICLHLNIFFLFVKKINSTGNPNIFSGMATLISKNKSVLSYQAESRLPNILSRMIPTTGLYHIIYTDYKNYTVLWSCTSFGLFHTGKYFVMLHHYLRVTSQ